VSSEDTVPDEPLRDAIKTGDVVGVGRAIEGGADVNRLYADSGTTPLTEAMDARNADVVRVLLEAGADTGRVGVKAPLCEAARHGDIQILVMLIAADADLEQVDDQGCTALMIAVSKGRLDVAWWLVDAGARRDVTDDTGRDLLSIAASGGFEKLFEFLAQWWPDGGATAGRRVLTAALKRLEGEVET